MNRQKLFLTVLLCLFFSVINQAEGQLAELRDLQQPYSGYSRVKNPELLSFIRSFTEARDSAALLAFYRQHEETPEAYRFFVKTCIPAHASELAFRADTLGVTDQNVDSFYEPKKKAVPEN